MRSLVRNFMKKHPFVVNSANKRTKTSAVTKSKVFVSSSSVPSRGLDKIKKFFDVTIWDGDGVIPPPLLREKLAGMEGLFCTLTDRVDQELIGSVGKDLKVVSTMSVGYDHVDVKSCSDAGILVGNTPGVLTETTAELCFGLLLATARRIPEAASAVKSGEWGFWKPQWMCGKDLNKATVGIVGMGRIGTAFAQRLSGWNVTLLYSGNKKPDAEESLAKMGMCAEHVDFVQLLQRSDFVVPHCPLNSSTRHMFNAEAFAKMKPDAIFVNTTRGPIVDQDALYNALKNGIIAAAGLDVTDPEPLPPSHPLLTLPNCVVLPHIGSASVETRQRMSELAADNLIAGLSGSRMPSQIN